MRKPETTYVFGSVSEKLAGSLSSLHSSPAAFPRHPQDFCSHLLFPLTLFSKPVMSVPKIPLKVLKVASVNPSSPLDSWLEPANTVPLGRLPFRQVSSNLGLVTSGLLTRVDLPWFPGQSRERSWAQSQDTGDFSKRTGERESSPVG